MSGTTLKPLRSMTLMGRCCVLAMAILLTIFKVQAQPYQPMYHPTSRPDVTVRGCELCGKTAPSFKCPPIQLLPYAQWPVFVRCFQAGGQSVNGNSNWEYVCLNSGNCGFIPEAYLNCQGLTACEAPPCC